MFGGGFGASSSPFGSTSPSPFAPAASPSPFGQPASSPFTATTTTGVFGQTQPAFGAAPAPAFGAASTPGFAAASGPAFSSTTPFGGSAFGAKPAGFGSYGAPAAAPASPFGAPASSAGFGAAAAAPSFGAASPWGATAAPATGFGAASAPAFGAASTPSAFAASTPAFGQTLGAFGSTSFAAAPAGGFGGATSFGTAARGTRAVAYRKTQETDSSAGGVKQTVFFNSISCMPEYSNRSAEELRWEDFQDGCKGNTGAAPAAGGSVFGAAQPAAASPFGGSTSPFGATTSTGVFGQPSQPAFGASPAAPFGAAASSPGFGSPAATSSFGTTAFGATSSSFGFGSAPAAGSSPFGAAPAASPFGAAPAASPFGQPASAPAFGAASSPGFGAASTPAFGGFGASSASPFGASSAPAFGAPASSAGFGFGAASAPAFGASSSAFSFTPAAGAFGAAPAASSPFGAPASSASLFGASSTPAFGSTGTGLFGAAKPAATPFGATGGGSLFGAASTPAFGAASTPAFGAAPAGGSLFGGTPASTPAFGAAGATGGGLFGGGGGGLFGGTPTFAPSAQLTPGALVPAQPVQAPTVGGSPYGVLPEPPKATPLPENKVGLTQQRSAAGALAGGTPRPMALISPRSITPRSGVRMRPRRSLSAAASRLSKSPADFLTLPGGAAGEGGADGAEGRLGSATPNGNVFVPRDNPRRLFIRDPLPSTAGAAGVTTSPSLRGGTPTPGPARTPGGGLRLTPGGRGGFAGRGEEEAEQEPSMAGLPFQQHLLENGGGEGGEGQEGGALEDSELARLLPRLTRPGYYTEPPLQQLAAMAREDPASLRRVPHFAVGARGVGSVRFLEPTDVRGLDLDRIVTLAKGSIEVYLEDEAKPEVGKGLNKPAVVTMERIFKVDKDSGRPTTDPEAIDRFTRKLKKVTAEQGAAFVSYDPQEGVWKFQVEHFSRYGLLDSDDEQEGESEGELEGFGVRRGAAAGAAAAAAEGDRHQRQRHGRGQQAQRAQREAQQQQEEDEGYEFVEEMELAPQESEGQRSASLAAEQHGEQDMLLSGPGAAWEQHRGGPSGRALPVALPAQLGMDPEDLQRIRDNLFASATRAPFPPAPGGERVIHVDLAQQAQQAEAPAGEVWPAATAGGAAAAPGAKAAPRRCSWQQRPQQALRAPVPAATAGVKAPSALPLLPSGPSPVSPAPLQRTAPLCPIPAPKPAAGAERCLPDAGLFAGASFRAGWGPEAQLAFAGGRPSSAAHIVLARAVAAPLAGAPAADPDRARARLEALLQLHMEHSQPDNAGAEDRAPRWRLRCGRGDDLRALTLGYIALCNEQAAQAEGAERTLLLHQATTWELVHVLFGAIEGEGGAHDPLAQRAQQGVADDDDLMDGESLHRLAAFKRRAALSRWLRDRARPAMERALWADGAAGASAQQAGGGSSGSEVAARLLRLLSGHQLAGAAALAAATGNVRLATLLAQAGTKSVAKEELAAQLAVWHDAGMDAHIPQAMHDVYALLAGDVDGVVPRMPGLDWRRALGMQLWYGTPPGASVAEALEAYSAAVAKGSAPAPLPLYAEQSGAPPGAPSPLQPLGGALDVAFELLRLHAVTSELGGEDEEGAAQREAALPQLLAQLLRPGGHSPDPLDYCFSWHLLSLLTAIGAVPAEAAYPQVFAAAMSFISQLECAGGLAPWAVYVALQLPDAPAGGPWEGLREKVVRELLARHCPEWGADEEAAEFFGATLRVPRAWLAEARAQWAQYSADDPERLRQLLGAGDWGEAHAVLCGRVAPRWFLGGPAGVQQLERALLALEPHAAEVDAAGGPGAWASGGGLYAAFFYLQGLYAQLLAGTGGTAGGCELSFEERMAACRRLAELLEEAAGRWGLPGAAQGVLQQAAYSRMSEALAGWVVADREGPSQLTPSPGQALLVAGLPMLRYAPAAAALQLAATNLAQSVA